MKFQNLATFCCIVISVFLLPLSKVAAQHPSSKSIFKWGNGMCNYEGTFIPSKVKAVQLKNTSYLMPGVNDRFNILYVMIQTPEDVKKIDIPAFERKLQDRLDQLKKLDIVPTPYWKEIKRQMLEEIDQYGQMEIVKLKAYSDPNILLTFPFSKSCTSYSDALIVGGETLLKAWKNQLEKECKENGGDSNCLIQYNKQVNTPEAEIYAKIHLIEYGWVNCCNKLVAHLDPRESIRMDKNFKSLFTSIKRRCEE